MLVEGCHIMIVKLQKVICDTNSVVRGMKFLVTTIPCFKMLREKWIKYVVEYEYPGNFSVNSANRNGCNHINQCVFIPL